MCSDIVEITDKLNDAVTKWCRQFENECYLNLKFSLTEYGTLMANDRLLCAASEVDIDSIRADVDTITFIAGEDIFDININWPFLGAPYVKYITKTSVLYKIA